MSKIDGRYVLVDNVTIESNGGTLRQVPGTDGGGGGGTGNFIEETRPLALTFADKYLDLTFIPADLESIEMYVISSDNHKSPPQLRGKDFSVVKDVLGGDVRRLAWDVSSVPGSSTAIPDPSDAAPTSGLQDILVASDTIFIRYIV